MSTSNTVGGVSGDEGGYLDLRGFGRRLGQQGGEQGLALGADDRTALGPGGGQRGWDGA